ncbi:MAG: FAD-linked oxidase C-terminal domain-containing protein [Phycisphaerae bacterium]|nr:FAD-linked oxidase C-terminal domain-containing protein [Phycisphaerae bacterium]
MAESRLKSFRQQLRQRVRGEVSFDELIRGIYATDASIYQIKPVAVFLPRDEDDVLAAINTAAEHNVSILPRGGGTSLGGQAVGEAMIIDFSKYMKGILELDVQDRWVRVQAGVVLDELNAFLAPHGLHFAPDPATSSRATIGGIMGNNSSGTKSIVFGITRDHVLETKVALSDGSVLEFKALGPKDYDRRSQGSGEKVREAQILSGFKQIIESNRREIEKRFPKIMRRVQGYNLDAFVNTDFWNLSKLMVGSEGTLGVFLEARLNLEPLAKGKIICVAHFTELIEAIGAVAPILQHGPSAVEIMDSDVIVMARKNLRIAPLCGFLQENPAAILIVEFFADTPQEAADKAKNLAADLQKKQLGYAWPIIPEPSEQAKVWAVRKNGLGLILGMKGDRKPIPFIEDCCVPVEVLPQYIDQLLSFCKSRGVPVAMYAHASVGTIHVRPILNLKQRKDIDNMKAIADYAFGLVNEYGGSWSGEHGDGRARSPYLERYFGRQIYNAFKEIKRLFDPAGLMNSGVIVDSLPMDQNLRYGTEYKVPKFPSEYHYREAGSFAAAVEMCTGVGACRQTLVGAMCPSYRLTGDTAHSPRGRANALRLAMSGQLGPDGLTGRGLYEVMQLCLSCKSCKSECPSNVDMARLKSEFLQKYYEAHGAPLGEKLAANSAKRAAALSGWMAWGVNWFKNSAVFRKVLEKIAGFDSRRQLPKYARKPFPQWFARRSTPDGRNGRKVVLFDDTYMNYYQTHVGISAVELLESCGYEVVLAQAGCCQRARISRGFLREAKLEGYETLRNLDTFIQQGLKVVVCEPSCASALTDDLPDLLDDEQLGQRIKQGVLMIDEFLAREIQEGTLDCEFTCPFQEILIHSHCHRKSLYGTTFMKDVLNRAPGVSVSELDAGCCGMTESFGYQKEHYYLSLKIAEQRLFSAIRNRQEGTVVVACGFGCRRQIADGTGTKALHWVETIRGKASPQVDPPATAPAVRPGGAGRA